MNKVFYHIQIKWSENSFLNEMSIEVKGDKAHIFDSFIEFNRTLSLASTCVSLSGGYDKVSFVVMANKEGITMKYEGRFDLHHFSKRQETTTGVISLKQHMLDHCKHVLGHSTLSEELKKSAAEWLSFLVST